MAVLTRPKLKRLSVGSSARADVICDYVDVTCSPDDSFVERLIDWLTIQGFVVEFSDPSGSSFRIGSGILRISTKFNHHRASASGACIGILREQGLFRDYVNLLGSVPHKVTRLDVALDVAIDAPIVLGNLSKVYCDGEFKFGRKSLRTKTLLEHRESDNLLSGTWYAGHSTQARVTARVYDKQLERARYGIITPPLTRYELTFRKDYGCSLWDVLMPTSLFYTHASHILVDPPECGYDDWSSRGLVPWVSGEVDTDLTVERFGKRVAFSPDIQFLSQLASKHFGVEGREILIREFARSLDASFGSLGADEADT